MSKSYFREDAVVKELNFLPLFKKLWPFIAKKRLGLSTVFVLVILYVSTSRSLPFIFGYAIDEGIKKSNLHLVYWLAGIYLGIEVVRVILAFLQNYLMQRLGNRVLFELREKLVQQVQALPLTYFDKNPIGRTITRVTNDVNALGELFSQGFTAFFVSTIEMFSIVLSLSIISLRLTLLTIVVGPLLFWISVRLSRKIRFYFKETKRKLAMINAYTAESIAGMKVLQLFNKTAASKMHFVELSNEYRDLQLKTVSLFARLWPVVEAFNIGTISTALLFGALFRNQLNLSIGEISAFVLLVQGFFKPLRVILERYNLLQNSLASADRVFDLLIEEAEPLDGQVSLPEKINGSIEFKNLSFRYSETSPWVIKNLNLKISPGERIGLVGRTGSGKSTLIALLQKFYSIQSGELLIDGLSVSKIAAGDLRRHIGVVQQENFIFRGSIASNIGLNNPEISRQRIEQAALMANCQELLRTHTLGLDAVVEESGANLSVGEKQLIAFARVLAFDPDVLILDEATANIDSVSESLIQKTTEVVTKNRTSLIIAHRLSTLANCNRILVLRDGEIVEEGSHTTLMALGRHYFELYQAQFENQNSPSATARTSADLI